ncbi:hypothetical protein BDP55DRAFT_676795 [Colletotrichum godetiae]|uniref:NAD-dependent epimerase/dehydratase domain-containing protein n=1 Tax=Colletotrichum godetiae TaxID=1209918 RepID=A0AAJ0AC78_9PEZI|nr:uncharacterized protein BDP55DRAFT_676795 [Colletotrichum godetiae]KAK1671235.1 hypothetical protein BDP55DRAFT_676795 [Colletotrichum godetiae]
MTVSHNILITGASGYLGGTLLARWASAGLTGYDRLFALVRTEAQRDQVKQYGAEPLTFSPRDDQAVRDAVVQNRITIVFYLIDAFDFVGQENFIKALGQVKSQTGLHVHLLHTSGAKIFSGLAGAPTDSSLLDTDPGLYDIQKAQEPSVPFMKKPVETNKRVIDLAQANDVRSYIFAPCIVYGKGEGFGNPISIQTVDIVKAAIAAGRVHSVTPGRPTWPVCHVLDNTTLYLQILRSILNGETPGYDKTGYFLAASGSVAWDDLYDAMAKALKARNAIEDERVIPADESALGKMAQGLSTESSLVQMRLAGKCTFTAKHGAEIGWKPQFPPEHILEAADDEVERILRTLHSDKGFGDKPWYKKE